MVMELIIRPARIDEAGALTALCLRSKRSNGYDDAFMAACVAELTVTPERLAQGGFWVAERQGPCGCAALRAGEVETFFVDPDSKGQGIGRALWGAVLAHAHETGMTVLHLDADPAAEGFYRRLGFETVGRAPSGSIPGRTLPRMERRLGERV